MATRLAVIGLGLIGGSLAWAARLSGAYSVTGFDAAPGVAGEAARLGAVDAAADSPAEAADGAQLVVVATPPLTVVEVCLAAAPACRAGTVLTDVAGFKGRVVAGLAGRLGPGVTFVGGHPMAGSERSGLAAADPGLFRGAPYAIIGEPAGRGADELESKEEGRAARRKAVAAVEGLARAIGARPLMMGAADHDRAVGVVSHLPYLLAVSLCLEAQEPGLLDLAAGALRDATRVAAGPPEMGFGMCAGNAEECARAWESLKQRMDELISSLGAGSTDSGVPAEVAGAAAFRRRWAGAAGGAPAGKG
ncbi:MAG TPA: prephenate dehydrogenase/arogenate dehydrogenase family protein [Bacillota bacterium]|jgi:prephenate dehydrogenase